MVFVFDIDQLSLPTPFYSVLVSVSVLVALSTVVVDFSSLARILGECSTIHFPPALFFFLSGDYRADTNSTL